MAVSISDAWNEINEQPTKLTETVSAKQVAITNKQELTMPPAMSRRNVRRVQISSDEPSSEDDDDDDMSIFSEKAHQTDDTTQSALIKELQQIRREESRRCTVYLAFGGVLFALLFVYIDRLQAQIKSLNRLMTEHPRMGLIDNGPSIVGRSQSQRQWYR